MKYAGITHRVLKRFAKRVSNGSLFALKDISGARNNAERSALKRFEKVGLMKKTGPGEYQRTSEDPIKEYYAKRQKGWAKRGAPGVKKKRRGNSVARVVAPSVTITPWDEDGQLMVRVGGRKILGYEVTVVPLKKGNGVDEN